MKKMLFVVVLFFVGLALKAEVNTIEFYLEDGSSKTFKIEDIEELKFIKSDPPYLMQIYIYGSIATYDIFNVTEIIILDSETLAINQSGSYAMFAFSDIDSINFIPNLFSKIFIGSQTWMRRNLQVDHYRNGDSIPQVKDATEWNNLKTGAWCYYNNDPAMEPIYGKLYNWYAVNDPRGLAPKGWQVASHEEWTILADYLGGDSVAGGKLKSTGTIEANDGLWYSPNTGATNESKFSSLPCGYRHETGVFNQVGYQTNWWSSTECTEDNAWIWSLYHNYTALGWCGNAKGAGLSVRCTKDVIKPQINSISPASAQVGDIVTISGSDFGPLQESGFVSFNSIKPPAWNYLNWSNTEIKVIVPNDAETGNISVTVEGIKSNEVEFTLKEIDPNYFETIQIGTQGWMSRNLNVSHYRNGDSILQVNDITTWKSLTVGAWCYYDNNPKNEAIYGKLYNWYAVNDPHGLAPEGWHVASDAEWTKLTDFLGGSNEAGGKLKTIGTIAEHNGLWKGPNSGATNKSGFSALPAGSRDKYNFNFLSTATYFWSSTESSADKAIYRMLSNMEIFCLKTNDYKLNGFSVRCLKD